MKHWTIKFYSFVTHCGVHSGPGRGRELLGNEDLKKVKKNRGGHCHLWEQGGVFRVFRTPALPQHPGGLLNHS